MHENDISYLVRGAIYKVNKNLGPGLLESLYTKALCHELTKAGLEIEREVGIDIIYDGESLGQGYRIDILVNDSVILEIKSVDELNEVHAKQLLTYLKLSGKRLGMLINFNEEDINEGILRKVNKLTDDLIEKKDLR